MNKPLFSESPSANNIWSPDEIIATAPDLQDRLLGWWYKLTAVPEPPVGASFVKREAARRVRLFSTVAFFFLLTLIIFFPACKFLPNPVIIYLDGALIGVTIITLMLNRAGRAVAAGILLIIASEIVLTAAIMTTIPFDGPSVQLYDLYLIIDLLAVSLLAPQTVFILAVVNSLFIGFDLIYQPHTPGLTADLAAQYIPMLVRPIGLQIMLAGVAYLWVRNANRAIVRAERAEMIAALEHTVAEERASFELARKQLEESIQELVSMHAEIMSGQVAARMAPYPTEAKILWPLVGVINSLWVRLQHTHQAEYELQHLKQAIKAYTEQLHQVMLNPQRPLPRYQTKTELDSLILALGKLPRVPREHER